MDTDSDFPASGYVTPQWVKRRYAISNSTLYKWLADSYLPPAYRVGPRAVRFRVEDIRAFEQRLKVASVSPGETL